jgi:hypothetical protein
MSLEMAHKVILPPKKNYIPQFLKQRDINSYFAFFKWLQSREKQHPFQRFDNHYTYMLQHVRLASLYYV